jgi:hypothetical protein
VSADGIESSFCKVAMARSRSLTCAQTRASMSSWVETETASFSIWTSTVARSANAIAADLSPWNAATSAKSLISVASEPVKNNFPKCGYSLQRKK